MTGKTHRAAGSAGLNLGPLEEQFGYHLKQAQHKVYRHFRASAGKGGVRPAEYALLVLVARNRGATATEIGAVLNIQKPNMVGMVRRLARRGLLRRVRSATDGRRRELALTAAGARLTAELIGRTNRHNEQVAAALTPGERAQLMRLLRKLCGG